MPESRFEVRPPTSKGGGDPREMEANSFRDGDAAPLAAAAGGAELTTGARCGFPVAEVTEVDATAHYRRSSSSISE